MGTELTTTSLSDLATRINQHHTLATQSARSAVEHALKAGDYLLQAKEMVKHGEWLPWLAANCTISERTAQGYMRVARELPNTQRVADLSLRDTLTMLSRARAKVPDLEFHPLAEMLPLIYGEEFESFIADVREHGLLMPIVLFEGKILDGRIRYLACQEAGVEPSFITLPDTEDPASYVVSVNVYRQHLSQDRRTMIEAMLLEKVEASVVQTGGGLRLAAIHDRG